MHRFCLLFFYTALCFFDFTLFAGHPFEQPKAWADEDGCASVLFALKNHSVEVCVPMCHFLSD